jgi:putative methyltransferase (TIGR04325 family)
MLRKLLPPLLYNKLVAMKPYGYQGDYPDWASAEAASSGYKSDEIKARLITAALAIKSGEARYERDSVLFSDHNLVYPVATALLHVCGQGAETNICDFGGGLGGYYFQHKRLLPEKHHWIWQVAELPATNAIGNSHLADEKLKFGEYKAPLSPENSLLILGCVLPYLDDPYAYLDRFYADGHQWVLVDKHPVLVNAEKDRLTIQKVSPKIYPASYPAWFFSESKWNKWWQARYELVFQYHCDDYSNLTGSQFSGYFLKRKKEA